MIGISGAGKENIGKIVEDIFDKIALQLIGNIPRLRNKKLMVFSTEQHYGLANLFVQAMANKSPNSIEQDALKSMLASADGYIESLKNKTKSDLTERVDGLVKEAKIRGEKVDPQDIEKAVSEEMTKAKSHLQKIAESEATKLRNMGTLMDISRVASSLGDEDPIVCFIVIKDGVACKECIRLHLMPDGVTPRVWKFSELKQGYHKRGEEYPSAFGLHPHCRCTLHYVGKSFGFDEKGHSKYISEDYDAHEAQRKASE
jgi:hypothetical protein